MQTKTKVPTLRQVPERDIFLSYDISKYNGCDLLIKTLTFQNQSLTLNYGKPRRCQVPRIRYEIIVQTIIGLGLISENSTSVIASTYDQHKFNISLLISGVDEPSL